MTHNDRSTSAQLRHDIDSGRTGDKAPGVDPAAAPLGTDAEAGGAGPTAAEIAQARAAEARPELDPRQNAVAPEITPAGERVGDQRRLFSPVLAIGLALAALLAWLVWSLL